MKGYSDLFRSLLVRLTPNDVAVILAEFALTKVRTKRDALEERDGIIRKTGADFYGPPLTFHAAAKRMEADLERYETGAWTRERDLSEPARGSSAIRQAHFRIMKANGGKSLGHRQLFNIFQGTRSNCKKP